MALEWYMRGTEGKPDAAVPSVAMREDVHAELFARAGLHLPHHGQGRYAGGRNRQSGGQPAPGPAPRPPLPPLPLLARAGDYYEDAAYAPGEVPGLLTELAAVGPRAGGAAGVVAALAALCEEAVRRRLGVVAVSD
jgi:hypothetical protein